MGAQTSWKGEWREGTSVTKDGYQVARNSRPACMSTSYHSRRTADLSKVQHEDGAISDHVMMLAWL